TFFDVELFRELHNPVGEIDQLDALIGGDHDRLTVDRQTACLRGRHIFDGCFANGDGRAFAHEVLSGVGVAQKNDQVMLRKTGLYWQQSRNRLYSAHNLTLTPGEPREVGWKAHTVSPL